MWDLSVLEDPSRRVEQIFQTSLFDWQADRIELVPLLPENAPRARWSRRGK